MQHLSVMTRVIMIISKAVRKVDVLLVRRLFRCYDKANVVQAVRVL